jgi:hypothetical protein
VIACTGPAPPVVPEPPLVVPLVQAPLPAPAPAPEVPAAAPAPPPDGDAAAPMCAHTRCDTQALYACGGTDGTRLAIIDELAQCAREATAAAAKASYRQAMFEQGFRGGVLVPGAAGHLVQAAALSEGQAKAIADAAAQVPRALAGQKPPYRSIDPHSCALVAAESGVELRCWERGGCVRACFRRHFVARIRVEAGGLRLQKTSEEGTDDGSCGCCG